MSRTLVLPNVAHLAELGVTREMALQLGDGLDLSPNTLAKIFDGRPVSVASLEKLHRAFPQLRYDDLARSQARPSWKADLSEIRGSLKEIPVDLPLSRWVTEQILSKTARACRSMVTEPPRTMSEAKFLSWIKTHFLTDLLVDSRLDAVCGKKAWEHAYVKAYFEENFAYANRLKGVEGGKARTRVCRIFIEPRNGFSAPEKETINRHVECSQDGVEAWLLPTGRHHDMEGSVHGLQSLLLDEGLGLVVFSTKTKNSAVTHTMLGDEMVVSRFEHPYLVHELKELFSSLKDIAEQVTERLS